MSGEDPLPHPKCERTDAHPSVPAVLAGTMVVIAAVCLLCGFLIAGRAGNRGPGLPGRDGLYEDGATARTDMERAWAALDRKAGTVPDGYAWIDRRAGIVQVPIDRAIDLVCAEQAQAAGAPEARPSP